MPGAASLGEIVRVALHQGTTPVFIPQGEPWRNGTCEQFNDTFDKRFFRSERFEDRDRLAHRALEFESFHNANHRYRATGKRTPDELTAGIERRQPTPLSELPAGWPEQGIEFIRFIRSDRKLRLLRRSIEMPETQVYRYLTARSTSRSRPRRTTCSSPTTTASWSQSTASPAPGDESARRLFARLRLASRRRLHPYRWEQNAVG